MIANSRQNAQNAIGSRSWDKVLRSVIATLAILLFAGSIGLKSASAAIDNSRFIVDVAIGSNHAVALAKDGTVWAWGDNFSGQLGLGKSIKESVIPSKIPVLNNIVSVDAGAIFTVALRNDGTVWVWGNNVYGQHGDGTVTTYNEPDSKGARHIADDQTMYLPVQVPNLSGIVGVAATNNGVVAWDQAGQLWQWGESSMGLSYSGMDVEYEKKKLVPQMSAEFKDVTSVSAASDHIAVISRDGSVSMRGNNLFGELGDSNRGYAIRTLQISGVNDVKRIDLSYYATIAFLNNGKVLDWGISLLENKGLNPTDPAAKDKFSVHLKPTETTDLQGFSAIETTTYNYTQPSFLALKPDGSVWTHGDNSYGELGVAGVNERYSWAKVTGLPVVSTVVGANGSAAAIGVDGSLWTWGKNGSAQLGDGTTKNRFTPASIGGFGSATPKLETSVDYQLLINGTVISLSAKPEIKGASVALQLGDAIKALGATLTWDKNKQSATIVRGKQKVVLKLNNLQSSVNGRAVKLPFAAAKKGNDWLIPVEWLVKQFGGTTRIDAAKQIVYMTLK
jgi:alpha-tubulin suppressor-like RCC1 family protein